MPAWLLITLLLCLPLLVPFMFSINEYVDVKVIRKTMEKGGILIYYYFEIEKDGKSEILAVTSEVYDSIKEGSIVTLYFNTGDGKVTQYKSILSS